jgi:Flp pilus assembly protein TadB
MARKLKLNAYVDESLAKQFKLMSKRFTGRIGMCLSAAMLQFMETDPQEQAALLKRVFDAQIQQDMGSAIKAAKEEQMQRIRARERRKQKRR